MDGILDALADDPGLILGLILGPAGMITGLLIITILCRMAIHTKRETEQSRRELAAYVAEGSITAEQAERLLVPRPWFATVWSGKTAAPPARSAPPPPPA